MNTLIRFLTFSASRPTHAYEREAYMLARELLALMSLVPSLLVSTPKTAPWILLSTFVSLVGAWSAQVARSGVARREETRRARNEKDVGLSCDAELRRASAFGSFFASLAPLIALGMTFTSALSSMTMVAGIAGAVGSAFDVAWSAWIYPAWRRRYTRERDALRAVRASVEAAVNRRLPEAKYEIHVNGEDWRSMTFAIRTIDEPEDAPTEVMTRPVARMNDGSRPDVLVDEEGTRYDRADPPHKTANEDVDWFCYVRCESLDEILANVDADIAEVGTRLYLNDDSPVVERGEGGWFVDWLDGTTCPVFLLSGGKERDRFIAMAEGRLT